MGFCLYYPFFDSDFRIKNESIKREDWKIDADNDVDCTLEKSNRELSYIVNRL